MRIYKKGENFTKNQEKNILIVDDTASTAIQIELTLKKYGHNTVIANNIDEALEIFGKKSFDIVTTDLLIPEEKDGLNLLINLKNSITSGKMNTKIIIISASSKNEYEKKCKELGADDYIEKNKNWQEELLLSINKRIYNEDE